MWRGYNTARGYLFALEQCLDDLNRLGMHTEWTDPARLSLEHVDRMLTLGFERAEQDMPAGTGDARDGDSGSS